MTPRTQFIEEKSTKLNLVKTKNLCSVKSTVIDRKKHKLGENICII